MAEGWANQLRGDVIEAYSAGVEPHGMNARAIAVMKPRPAWTLPATTPSTSTSWPPCRSITW